jgi:hypothetical protein
VFPAANSIPLAPELMTADGSFMLRGDFVPAGPPLHALSLGASTPRSVRAARFATLARFSNAHPKASFPANPLTPASAFGYGEVSPKRFARRRTLSRSALRRPSLPPSPNGPIARGHGGPAEVVRVAHANEGWAVRAGSAHPKTSVRALSVVEGRRTRRPKPERSTFSASPANSRSA